MITTGHKHCYDHLGGTQMLKKVMRNFVCIGALVATLSGSLTCSFAEFKEIYREEKNERISSGVTKKNIKIFTSEGWIDANVITIDLENKNTALELLRPNNTLSNRDTLYEMVESKHAAVYEKDPNSKVISAINGDFFNSNKSSSIGPTIDGGVLFSSKYNDDSFNSFELLKNGTAALNQFVNPTITFKNLSRRPSPINVDYINKPFLFGDAAICLTPEFSEKTLGYDGKNNIFEIVIDNDIIIDLRYNKKATTIPKNGYVVCAYNQKMYDIGMNFVRGDSVELIIDDSLNKNIDLSIGGGSILLQNGEIPNKFSLPVPGKHPRTALGIDKSGSTLLLLTVNGRTSSYRGTTESETASLLKELGAYNGINLDGGGSSELLVRNPGTVGLSIANHLSDGVERRIYNGLSVIDSSRITNEVDQLIIETKSPKILKGASRDFSAKAFDANYNPIVLESEDIQWAVSGVEGTFDGNRFFPTTSGRGVIYALCGKKLEMLSIEVYEGIEKLTISPSKINFETAKPIEFTVSGYTEDGYKIPLLASDLSWDIPGKIGTMANNKLVLNNKETSETSATSSNEVTVPDTNIPASGLNEESKNYITATFSKVQKYLPVSVASTNKVLEQFEASTDEEKSQFQEHYKFASYPEIVTGAISVENTNTLENSAGATKLEYDFTTTDATRAAYMQLSSPLKLSNSINKLGLWVNGEQGNSHWLRGTVLDGNGKAHTVDFSKDVNWDGWRYLAADIPSSLARPLTLSRIYLVETDPTKKDAGYVLIDNLTAEIGSQYGETPRNKEYLISWETNGLGSEPSADNLMIFKGTSASGIQEGTDSTTTPITSGIASSYDMKHTIAMNLDNHSRSIRANGADQWKDLLSSIEKAKNTGKALVIAFDDKYSFSDPLEEDLFLSKLYEVREKDIPVWLIFRNEPKSYMKKYNGLNLIKLSKDVSEKLFIKSIDGNVQFDLIP